MASVRRQLVHSTDSYWAAFGPAALTQSLSDRIAAIYDHFVAVDVLGTVEDEEDGKLDNAARRMFSA